MLDPTTQSNYTQITIENSSFDWSIDWANKSISGSVVHDLKIKADSVTEVVLDTADLNIREVLVQDKNVSFELTPKHTVMGSALHIPLPSGLRNGASIAIKVWYNTTELGNALQWLEKEQTQGKTFPFLFSQCQPIHARALAPLQDTPSVKFTYSARISSVLPVLLSAIRQAPPQDGPAHESKVIGKDVVTYVYKQPIPVPSYLIAIAGGDVVYRALPKVKGKKWTSGIWAEPVSIEAAYWEFSEDTGRFLATAEEIVGPYRFGVYDLLVLPPSFPYGGMENACLTFLTPTLLTGDRSLTDVVVHELTHSWFGNGITHANATHFWLNEGWTTYMERVLQEILHSPANRGFAYIMGLKALKDALNQHANKPKYQRLVIEFAKGEDPDEAYSPIPYEKGSNFLLHIERTLGGLNVFLPYVKDYVSTFSGQSITTDQWKSHLFAYYAEHGGQAKVDLLNTIDFDAWLYGEGLDLPVEMTYDTSLADAAYVLAKRWNNSRTATDVSKLDFTVHDLDELNANQIAVFLGQLCSYGALPSAHLFHLASLYKLDKSGNAEIRTGFYEIALMDPRSSAAQSFASAAADWVTGADDSGVVKGRMKFCREIFRYVYKVNPTLAVDAFMKSRQSFHPIARSLIEKDLKLA